ncbi:MAG: hypothetical protein P4M08_14945 [Oligoflexia bacterium]|nr:hypothetical protein [Oligoflexia bacterium]
MKRPIYRSLIAAFVTVAAAVIAHAENSAQALKLVREKTGFEERLYERVSGPYDQCVSDVMPLKYELTGDNVVLHLGERFIFADLAQSGYVDTSDPQCRVQVTTDLAQGLITQKTINDCKSPSDSFQYTQQLRFSNGLLTYTHEYRAKIVGKAGEETSHFTCVFKAQEKSQ